MPIYEYKCTKCGKVTEKLVSSAVSSETAECADCKAEAVKIMSAGSFQHKSASVGGCAQGSTMSPQCAQCPSLRS